MPESQEQVIALDAATRLNDHTHKHSSWCSFCRTVGAALLEARADGFDDGQGISPQSARNEAKRLRAEAAELRNYERKQS